MDIKSLAGTELYKERMLTDDLNKTKSVFSNAAIQVNRQEDMQKDSKEQIRNMLQQNPFLMVGNKVMEDMEEEDEEEYEEEFESEERSVFVKEDSKHKEIQQKLQKNPFLNFKSMEDEEDEEELQAIEEQKDKQHEQNVNLKQYILEDYIKLDEKTKEPYEISQKINLNDYIKEDYIKLDEEQKEPYEISQKINLHDYIKEDYFALEKKEEASQKEQLKEELPIQIKKKQIENIVEQEGDQVVPGFRRAVAGEALERYLEETKEKKTAEKRKSAVLDKAIASAEACLELIRNGDTSLTKKIREINQAIRNVDQYIKETKGYVRKNSTIAEEQEMRTLREAAKMLRIQLFLEKTELYEREENEIDEMQLYKQQLESDAEIKLYHEFHEKNKSEKEEAAKKKDFNDDMQKRKSESLVMENDRQIALYSYKIGDSEKKAKELQEKISVKGYSIRHKQFQRNEVYQLQVERKIAQIRPRIVKEWMSDNLTVISKNAKQLEKLFEKEQRKDKTIGDLSMNEMGALFKTELKDGEALDVAATQYDVIYQKLSKMTNDLAAGIGDEIKNLIAAQVVLFEKRELLKKEYLDANKKLEEKAEKPVEKQPEEGHAEQSVSAFEKQQEIEKEAVEIQNEEKPIELEDENKQEQALVVYRNLYESLKQEETAMVQQNSNQFQTMMNAFAMYISNLQQKSVTLDIHKNFENSLKDYIATVTVKAPAIQGNKPMEIKISMEISRKELNQMLSFVNQKWKNIRPAKQAYKLLQSGNVEQAWNALQEKGTRTFVQSDAIIEPIHRMLESEPIQYQQNAVIAQTKKESHVKPANLIIAESIMEVEKELKEKQSSGMEEQQENTEEVQEKLLEKIIEKLDAEKMNKERQEQADETHKLEEQEAVKRKQTDLAFQENNNEYGLQEMASEEKEKQEQNQKHREYLKAQSQKVYQAFMEKYDEVKSRIDTFLATSANANDSYELIDAVRDDFVKYYTETIERFDKKGNNQSSEEADRVFTELMLNYSNNIYIYDSIKDYGSVEK